MLLQHIPIDKSWSFTNCTIKDTSYITHSYYTYPAKFIPQLAQRLIVAHSQKGQFTKVTDANLTLAYPTECILIMKEL